MKTMWMWTQLSQIHCTHTIGYVLAYCPKNHVYSNLVFLNKTYGKKKNILKVQEKESIFHNYRDVNQESISHRMLC